MAQRPRKQPPRKIQVKRVDDDEATQPTVEGKTELDELLQWRKQPVDMQKIERGPRRRILPWVLAGLGVLFLATIAGFVVFNRAQRFSEQGIQLTVDVPVAATSGGEVVVVVSYLNDQRVAVTAADLALEYPEGFTVQSADPKANGPLNDAWTLGRVRSGFGGTITIRGTIVGTLQAEKTFRATLTYRPANFNSDFTRQAEASTTIGSSRLSFDLTGATRAVAGKSVTMIGTLKNTSETDLERVKVIYDPDEGFDLTKAEPEAKDNAWLFEKIAPGQDQTMTLTGTFSGQTGDTRELAFRIGLVDGSGNFTLQSSASLSVALVNSELTLELTLNGKADPGPVQLGDSLVYTVRYKNNSDFELKDAVITGQWTGTPYSWNQAVADPKANLTEAAKGKVVWTKATVPALALLKAGDSGTLKLTIPLRGSLENPQAGDTKFSLESVWKATTARVESLGGSVEGTSGTLTTKVGTAAKLSTEARYYDEEGGAVGTGPLPPVVGKTTAYRVSWLLSNTLNDLTNVTVSTTLPDTAFWTGKVKTASAGALNFDSSTRTVSWTINRVPAHTGTLTSQLNAEFEVSVTPKTSDVGLLMVLTDKTKFAATDEFTGAAVTQERPSLTTELPNDIQGRGKGIVVGTAETP